MEQNVIKEQPPNEPGSVNDAIASATSPSRTGTALSPQAGGGTCARCATTAGANPNGAETASFVYALGRVEPSFPTPALEKEYAQATGRGETAGLTDRQAVHSVLSQRPNRYLARQMCWRFTIEGVDTYILQPLDPADFDLLLDAVRPVPRATDVDVIIGVRGPLAPPEVCNGLILPIVVFDQMYSFDVDSLVKAIERPDTIPKDKFGPAAEELFVRIMQLADNNGQTAEHRALNYLAVRSPAIYAKAAEEFGRNFSLTSVEVLPSRLSGLREIKDVVFTYANRQTDVTEKYFTRVDVTEKFPFLVSKLLPYYDR